MIRWDEEKGVWLIHERGVSFREIADLIHQGDYLDILEHPGRPDDFSEDGLSKPEVRQTVWRYR